MRLLLLFIFFFYTSSHYAMDPTSPIQPTHKAPADRGIGLDTGHPERAQRVEGRRDTHHALAPEERRRMDVPREDASTEGRVEQRKILFGYIYKGWEGFFERKLDSEKIPVDTCDADGNSLLHVASAAAQPKIVKILLDRGASVHAISAYTSTPPLYDAITCNPDAPKVVELLLAHGADALFVSKHYKQNPLFLAAVGGYVLLVRLILTKSRYKIEHKISEGVEFEKAVQEITDARIAKGKKLIGLQDYKGFTALVYINIDLEVLPKKPDLQEFEVERMKGLRAIISLLNVESFEKNFGKEINDDVRKILIESQKNTNNL